MWVRNHSGRKAAGLCKEHCISPEPLSRTSKSTKASVKKSLSYSAARESCTDSSRKCSDWLPSWTCPVISPWFLPIRTVVCLARTFLQSGFDRSHLAVRVVFVPAKPLCFLEDDPASDPTNECRAFCNTLCFFCCGKSCPHEPIVDKNQSGCGHSSYNIDRMSWTFRNNSSCPLSFCFVRIDRLMPLLWRYF